MISIGVRLGMRVIDNLNLKWEDLLGVEVGAVGLSGLKRKLIKNELVSSDAYDLIKFYSN
jgi:hypothetical protein